MHEKDRWEDDVSLLAVKISDTIRAAAQDTESRMINIETRASILLIHLWYRVTAESCELRRDQCELDWQSARPPSLLTCHILIPPAPCLPLTMTPFGNLQRSDLRCETWIDQLMNSGIVPLSLHPIHHYQWIMPSWCNPIG